MDQSQSLYIKLIEITDQFLGPASDRFITRQIKNHLRIRPDQLQQSDLDPLIDWLQVSMAYLTDDGELVKDYVHKLKNLAKQVRR